MSKFFYSTIISIIKPFSKALSRTTVEGLENIPKTGAVIVAPNHISNIDPVLLGCAIASRRQLKALAKESLFTIPIVGSAIKNMGHIPVKRNSPTASQSLEKAVEIMKEKGEAVAIYPEGTIPINLSTLGAFKNGASRLALTTGASIIPIAQWGAHNVLPRHGGIKDILQAFRKRPKNTIIIGKPLEHNLLDGTPRDKFNESDVTEITISLAEKIEELVEPMRNKEKLEKESQKNKLEKELRETVAQEVF